MKEPIGRVLILAAIVLGLALAILLWPRNHRQQSEHSSPEITEQAQKPDATQLPSSGDEPLQSPVAVQQSNATTPPAAPTGGVTVSRAEKLRGAVETLNVPVAFWGKVVDQDNAPLAGARVRASIRSWHVVASPMGDATFDAKEVISGSDGQFMIDGGQGDSLTIEALEKEGYEPEPKTLRGFGYTTSDKFTPDPSSPVVLRMWKADRKAHLVSGSKRCSMVPDGRVYTLDLMRGTLTESPTGEGDLRVAIKREADAAWGKHYDWSLKSDQSAAGWWRKLTPNPPCFKPPKRATPMPTRWKLRPQRRSGATPQARNGFI